MQFPNIAKILSSVSSRRSKQGDITSMQGKLNNWNHILY